MVGVQQKYCVYTVQLQVGTNKRKESIHVVEDILYIHHIFKDDPKSKKCRLVARNHGSSHYSGSI